MLTEKLDRRVLFSICIPVYNVALYINQCLDSILNQGFDDYEVVMVDDGSKDDSLKICEEYQKKDSRFHVVHQDNAGAIAARKAALQLANGEYALVLDSDDYLAEGLLKRLCTIIEQYDPEIIKLNHAKFSETTISECRNKFQGRFFGPNEMGTVYDSLIYDPELKGIHTGVMYSLCMTVARREKILKYQLIVPDEIRLGEDLAVTAPMTYEAKSIYFTDTIDYYYRDTPNGMMNSFKEDALQRIEVLIHYLQKKIPNQYDPAIDVYAVNMIWGYAAAAAIKYNKQEFCDLMKTEMTVCFQTCVKNCKIYKPSVKESVKLFLLRHGLYGVYHRLLMRMDNIRI